MSTPMLVVVAEVIILLLGFIGLQLFFRSKSKKAKTKALEELLDNIEFQESKRKKLLHQHLQKGYALENQKADERSESIVVAEKLFLQAFIQQQIEQTPITDFYDMLCELLDQYLLYIPTLNSPDLYTTNSVPAVEKPKTTAPKKQKKNDSDKKVDKEDLDNDKETDEAEARKQEPDIENAEPDWEDAFSEAGDDEEEETIVIEKTEVNQASEVEVETQGSDELNADTEEAEPDWGDAFSQSGDEMDEATKQGFEGNQDKE
jgi:hypothetical protein